MPKFKIKITDGRSTWEEPCDVETSDPRGWAEQTIGNFNKYLRPQELRRELLGIEIVGKSEAHAWDKTNLSTIIDRGRMYDTARFTKCGITAKRFGLGGYTRDPMYKAKKYEKCGEHGTARVERARELENRRHE